MRGLSELKLIVIFIIVTTGIPWRYASSDIYIDSEAAAMVSVDEDDRCVFFGKKPVLVLDSREFRIEDYAGRFLPDSRTWLEMRSDGIDVDFSIKAVDDHTFHCEWEVSVSEITELREIATRFQFLPNDPDRWQKASEDFHWIPNIKKNPEHIASDHTFRSPVVIMIQDHFCAAVIPDLDVLAKNRRAPHFLNMRFHGDNAPFIEYGVAHYKPEPHMYYSKTGETFQLDGILSVACYILVDEESTRREFLHRVQAFIWDTYGHSSILNHEPQVVPFSTCARYGYDMALRELWVDGPEPGTGGITLSTYYDKEKKRWGGRTYPMDIWFHSWFNNMRTAYGQYLWGKRLERPEWMTAARSTARLLLSSPRESGLFCTIYRSHDKSWESSGQGGGNDVYHLPDNAWTAYWLLRFHDDLEHVEGADSFLMDFAQALIELQHDDGSFPARVYKGSLETDSVLDRSASAGLPLWFLAEMRLRGKFPDTVAEKADAAIKSGTAYLHSYILPHQRFDDFELYLSCSSKPFDFYDPVSCMYGQNTLSIQWCAEAFRSAWLLYNDQQDYDDALFCADILSLYQQVWNAPYLSFHTFGGFGVMNTDAEWNDARQAQFSETLANFYMMTGDVRYLERAVAASRAGFALMVMDENRDIAPYNYKGVERNFEIHGSSAENYGHSGLDKRSYQSGFHWGVGSALCTAAILYKTFGDIYIDASRTIAIGLDGVVIDHRDFSENRTTLTVDILPGIRNCSGIMKNRDMNDNVTLIINGQRVDIGNDSLFTWQP